MFYQHLNSNKLSQYIGSYEFFDTNKIMLFSYLITGYHFLFENLTRPAWLTIKAEECSLSTLDGQYLRVPFVPDAKPVGWNRIAERLYVIKSLESKEFVLNIILSSPSSRFFSPWSVNAVSPILQSFEHRPSSIGQTVTLIE